MNLFRNMYWRNWRRQFSVLRVRMQLISTYQNWWIFFKMTTQWEYDQLLTVLCAMLQRLGPFQWWNPWFKRVQVRHCYKCSFNLRMYLKLKQNVLSVMGSLHSHTNTVYFA